MATRTSTAGILKAADPLPRTISEALSGLRDAIARREELLVALADEAEDHERTEKASLAEWLERHEAETKADASRLRADIMSKDAKIKEIQSKFSFVVGITTERLPKVEPA